MYSPHDESLGSDDAESSATTFCCCPTQIIENYDLGNSEFKLGEELGHLDARLEVNEFGIFDFLFK